MNAPLPILDGNSMYLEQLGDVSLLESKVDTTPPDMVA
jgi:hypothetical protein